jgi:hypothetical protein
MSKDVIMGFSVDSLPFTTDESSGNSVEESQLLQTNQNWRKKSHTQPDPNDFSSSDPKYDVMKINNISDSNPNEPKFVSEVNHLYPRNKEADNKSKTLDMVGQVKLIQNTAGNKKSKTNSMESENSKMGDSIVGHRNTTIEHIPDESNDLSLRRNDATYKSLDRRTVKDTSYTGSMEREDDHVVSFSGRSVHNSSNGKRSSESDKLRLSSSHKPSDRQTTLEKINIGSREFQNDFLISQPDQMENNTASLQKSSKIFLNKHHNDSTHKLSDHQRSKKMLQTRSSVSEKDQMLLQSNHTQFYDVTIGHRSSEHDILRARHNASRHNQSHITKIISKVASSSNLKSDTTSFSETQATEIHKIERHGNKFHIEKGTMKNVLKMQGGTIENLELNNSLGVKAANPGSLQSNESSVGEPKSYPMSLQENSTSVISRDEIDTSRIIFQNNENVGYEEKEWDINVNNTLKQFIDKTTAVATWNYFPDFEEPSVIDPEFDLSPENCTTLNQTASLKKKIRLPSNESCSGFAGVLHIQRGDRQGDSVHVFFQSIISQLIWADQHNFLPWIHMTEISNHVFDPQVHSVGEVIQFEMLKGMEIGWARDQDDPKGYKFPGKPRKANLIPHNFSIAGTGIWEHYFEPVSNFYPGDQSCVNKPLVTFASDHQIIGLDYFAPWTPRFSRSSVMDYIYHNDSTVDEWLEHQREYVSRVIERYVRFNAHLVESAACAHPNPDMSLGMHIESNRKGSNDIPSYLSLFLPFCEEFVNKGGGDIFIVTSSPRVVHAILHTWPSGVVDKINIQHHAKSLISQNHKKIEEILTSVLALSTCTYLLHDYSALAEAAIYINPSLFDRSLNLDSVYIRDSNTETLDYFVNEVLPKGGLNEENTDLSLPIADWDYFPNISEQSVKDPVLNLDPSNCSTLILETSIPTKRPPSEGACDGYKGILHIQQGDFGGASGTIFFQYMVGFLFWADQHNFKPWVHFNSFSAPIFDQQVHNQGSGVNFTMLGGMTVAWARDKIDPKGYKFPGKLQVEEGIERTPYEFYFEGTGVWEHYFEPVSDFSPGDPSCTEKPLVSLDLLQISLGLHAQAPWGVHAWRYWMPDHIALPQLPLEKWFAPQRKRAARIVKRYIRFNEHMEQRAACAHPRPNNSLGMHIRHGDKGIERRVIPVSAYLPYCEEFIKKVGGSIYLATDSALVVEEIMRDWPTHISDQIVRQKEVRGLSRNESAAFSLGLSAHLTNIEALTDALAMSKCSYLLHGLSALTEAALYLNPGLVRRSVNLDDINEDTEEPLISPITFANKILKE